MRTEVQPKLSGVEAHKCVHVDVDNGLGKIPRCLNFRQLPSAQSMRDSALFCPLLPLVDPTGPSSSTRLADVVSNVSMVEPTLF